MILRSDNPVCITILGIDPGLNKTGWAMLSCDKSKVSHISSGLISTKTIQEQHVRLYKIASEIDDLLLRYNPSLVCMEETFVNNNPGSSLKLGYARGAIMSVIGKYESRFIELKPNTIKKTVTGNGHADKMQIMSSIKLLIGNIPQEFNKTDIADAIAIAYSGYIFGSSLI